MGEINLFTYQGTLGAVQRDTSIAREESERTSGETKIRAERFLAILYGEWEDGVTWREMQDIYERRHNVELHHGQISGLLTNLHKTGAVFICQGQKRNGCYAYIHSAYKSSFPEDLRFDSPVQTKAGIRRAALEKMLGQLRRLEQEVADGNEMRTALALILAEFDRTIHSE